MCGTSGNPLTTPRCLWWRVTPLESRDTGVGSICASMLRLLPWPLLLNLACHFSFKASHSSGVFPAPMSLTTGVGSNDEQTVSLVTCSDIGRSKSCPLRIEPEAGKVTQDGVESKMKVS